MEELDFDGLGGALGVADCFDDDKPRDREPPPYEIAVSEYLSRSRIDKSRIWTYLK